MYVFVAAVLLVLGALGTPARAQDDTITIAMERGRSDGRAVAARTPVESAWIERGTFAGLVAVPAAPAVGIATRSPAAVTLVAFGPPLASLARARFSRVELPSEHQASLAGAGPAYVAAYRTAYVRAVQSRRLKRTAVGVLRGAAAGGVAAYVVLLIGYAGAS